MRLKRVAMAGITGFLGLGLIGAGAHAAFTTSTTSKQTVTAGTLDVVLHATPGLVTGPNTQPSITLKSAAPEGSTFTTGTVTFTVKNIGNTNVTQIKFTPGDTYTSANGPDSALSTEVSVCVTSGTHTTSSTHYVLFNGPLHTFLAGRTTTGLIRPGTHTTYVVNLYAGNVHTACGSVTTGVAPIGGGTSTSTALTNSAEGGVIQATMTVVEVG